MTCSQMRQRARDALRGHWGLAIGVAALAALLGGVGTSFLPNVDIEIPALTAFLSKPILEFGSLKFTFQNGIFGLLAFLFGGCLELGYTQFILKLHDGREAEFSDLFSQFYRFLDGFVLHLLRGLYVLLWSLLLIIPGIIKQFSYAMAPYIMIDHPDMLPNDAITLSKQMMDGHKGELFVLKLTFIGWIILAALSYNLGYLALNPYMKTAEAAFYRQLAAQYNNVQ